MCQNLAHLLKVEDTGDEVFYMPNLCIISFLRVTDGRQGIGILRRCTVLGVCNCVKSKQMNMSFSLIFSLLNMFTKDLYWLSHIPPPAIENGALAGGREQDNLSVLERH